MVDPTMEAELQGMATALGIPLSTFVYTILQIGLSASGNTFAAFGNTIEGLKAVDDEHDSKK